MQNTINHEAKNKLKRRKTYHGGRVVGSRRMKIIRSLENGPLSDEDNRTTNVCEMNESGRRSEGPRAAVVRGGVASVVHVVSWRPAQCYHRRKTNPRSIETTRYLGLWFSRPW